MNCIPVCTSTYQVSYIRVRVLDAIHEPRLRTGTRVCYMNNSTMHPHLPIGGRFVCVAEWLVWRGQRKLQQYYLGQRLEYTRSITLLQYDTTRTHYCCLVALGSPQPTP